MIFVRMPLGTPFLKYKQTEGASPIARSHIIRSLMPRNLIMQCCWKLLTTNERCMDVLL